MAPRAGPRQVEGGTVPTLTAPDAQPDLEIVGAQRKSFGELQLQAPEKVNESEARSSQWPSRPQIPLVFSSSSSTRHAAFGVRAARTYTGTISGARIACGPPRAGPRH